MFSLSPDLDAFFCYLIVGGLGFFTAGYQVYIRFRKCPGAWAYYQVWIFFTVLALLPVGVFWLFDRVGLFHDTSLFGAILVGVAFPKILSTGNIPVAGPDASRKTALTDFLAALWNPIIRFSDHVVDNVRERSHIRRERSNREVIESILREPKKLDQLLALAVQIPTGRRQLLEKLNEIDAVTTLTADLKKREKVEILLGHLEAQEDFIERLHHGKLISGCQYYWEEKEWNGKSAAILILVAVFSSAIFLGTRLIDENVQAKYALYRIQKSGTSHEDRFRNTIALETLLQNVTYKNAIQSSVCGTLRSPAISDDVLESCVRLYVFSYFLDRNPSQIEAAIHTLRAQDPRIRARFHKTLLALFPPLSFKGHEDLTEWKTDESTSASEIEFVIEAWRNYLKQLKRDEPDLLPAGKRH